VLRQVRRPEAVHQLRVAARRLRSALATFRPVVEDDRFEGLKSELKWLADSAGEARDLDVFLAETLAPALEADPARRGLAALGERMEQAQAGAHARVAAAVASARFRDLVLEAAAWAETGAWLTRTGADRERPARAFAAQALTRRRRKLLKCGRDLAALDDAARHKVRIEAKKLRYAADAFAPLFDPKAAARFLKPLKALQDDLGQLNDAATAERLAGRLSLDAAAAFAAGRLAGELAGRKPALIGAAAKALRRLEAADGFWSR
jgi:CHAD domain-containing protein